MQIYWIFAHMRYQHADLLWLRRVILYGVAALAVLPPRFITGRAGAIVASDSSRRLLDLFTQRRALWTPAALSLLGLCWWWVLAAHYAVFADSGTGGGIPSDT